MKLFALFTNYLKKWRGDESSSHNLLLVILYGLCLPLILTYTGLHALGMQTHKVISFIGYLYKKLSLVHIRPTGMSVSAAVLSRQDKKLARLYG
ncbi:hypothetical protein QUF74_15125 [Candidatus Halobeggiatoa sp. HSG11]|nr:hypothetical protein [Candidatus Halobeggiatoa sp. HSG11]